MARFRERLRMLFLRAREDREMDEEMRFHLECAIEANRRLGMSPAEARRQAMITFGGTEQHREGVRDARWFGRTLALTPDVKLALRMLRKNPALSVIGGLGLAVAIAMATGFFTFMTLYYSSPPLHEGERIVTVENADVRLDDISGATLFDYHVWREGVTSLQELAAYRTISRIVSGPGVEAGAVEVAEITASGFRLARVPPLIGRPILDADENVGAPAVLVLGYDEWQRYFAADSGVIGQEVRLGETLHTIVGVMPEGFRFPVNNGYWTALSTERSLYGPGEGPTVFVFGRLAPDVGIDGVRAELAAIGSRMAAEYPQAYENLAPATAPYVRHLLDVQQYPAWFVWLMQLFGGLLLAAIAINVAVLVYARTARRMAEITVRTALGASRRRIVLQLFIEALALSAAAAVLGLLVAQIGYRQLLSISDLQGDLPYWTPENLPPATILYAAGLAVFAAFIVGVLPALRATGRHLESKLRQIGGGAGMPMGATWTALIVVQVAVAVAVLPAVVGVAWNTIAVPPPIPTFPAEELLTFRLIEDSAADLFAIREARFSGRDPAVLSNTSRLGASDTATANVNADRANLQAELLRRVGSEPGVVGVTYASSLPIMGRLVRVEIDGLSLTPDALERFPQLLHVDLAYFDVLGVRQLAGRRFEPGDLVDGRNSVIVNRAFVQQLVGGGEILGSRIRVVNRVDDTSDADEPWLEVVGIVDDMYVTPRDPDLARAVIYRPIQLGGESLSFAARTRGTTPADLAPRVREIAAGLAPDRELRSLPMDATSTGGDQDGMLFLALVVALITSAVLLLSAAGISALVSFAVTRRHREIGIRTALGGSRSRVVRAILSRSIRQLGAGLFIGAAGAALLDRITGGAMLGGEAATLLALVSGLMITAGLLASLGPTRRALRVQPMEALRQE